MITLDDRFYRPEQRTRITLDTKLIGYKAGFRHGIATGVIVSLTITILSLIFR